MRLPLFPPLVFAPLLLAALAAVASADEPAGVPYRRVYAPADRPDVWPETPGAWVPVEQDEVATLLRSAAQPAGPRVDDAAENLVLRARVADSVLTAEGELTLALHGQREAFLAWPTGQTPVRSARWSINREPAVLGDWGSGPNPPHGLLVDREGTLLFQLSGRPVSETDTRAEYLLGLPPAVSTVVTLDLPDGVRPSVDRGIIESEDDQGESPTESRWTLRAPPGGPIRLVLVKPTTAAATPGPGFDATQQVTHTIDEQGVRSVCRFRLTAARELPGAVRLVAPPGAALIAAAQDSLPVDWTLREGDAAGTVIRVALQKTQQRECELELTFAAPWAPDEPTSLPMPALLGAHWKEGSAEVRLEPPIELVDVAELTHAHREPPSGGAATPADLRLRLSRSNPTIRVQVGRRGDALRADVARSVLLTIDPQRDLQLAQSTVTISVSNPTSAPRHELRAELDRYWGLTSAEATPRSILEDSDVIQRGGRRVVVLRLAPTANDDATASITLRLARRVPRGDAGVALTDLLGVELTGAQVQRDALSLSPAAPYQLRVRGGPTPGEADGDDGPVRFASEQTPLRQLLAGGIAEVVGERTPAPGRCEVDVTHTGDSWVYRAELTAPASRPGGMAMVRFEPPLPETAVLSVGDRVLGSSALLVPPRDDSIQVQAGMLALPLEENGPTTFQIDFRQASQQPLDIPLPSLDRVSPQQGRLTLRGAGRGGVGLRSSGLTPTTTADAPENEQRFTFDPSRVGTLDLSALVTRQQEGPAEQPLRLLGIETRVLANGRLVHHLRRLMRSTRGEQTVELPDHCVLLGAHDDLGLPIAEDTDQQGRTVLAFAAADEPREVSITLEAIGAGWQPGARLPLEGLAHGAASAWNWRVFLPSTYDLAGPSCGVVTEYGRRQNRLLGPVAGVLRAGGLNPFAPSTWRATETAAQSAEPWSSGNCPPGWRCYEIPCVGATTPELEVRHHDQLVGGAATLGVLVACAAVWAWPRATRLLVNVALLSAVLALLLPAVLAVWAASVWLGLIAGAMLSPLARAVEPLIPSSANWRPSLSAPTPTSASTATTLGLLLALTPAAVSTAAAPDGPLPTVLIPVDDQAQPTGDKWYLEGEVLNQLRRASEPHSAAPAEWALNRVTLQGALRGPLASSGAGAEPWQLVIEVTTRRRDVQAVLPLRRGEAAWPDKADVDGIAAPLAWDSSGDGCSVRIAEPGRRRIAITFTPVVAIDEMQPEIHLSLPRCSRAQLRLTVAESVSRVQAPGLATPLSRGADGAELVANLSGENELVLQWQTGLESTQVSQAQCDQQQWLTVSPDGATLEVRCVLEGVAPLPRSLSLQTPDSVAGAATPRLEAVGGWDAKQTKLTYGGSFPLDRESGYGRYSIPAMTPRGVALRSRLMAFTAEQGLSVSTPATTGVATFDTDEFAARWGQDETDEPPDRAYVASDADARWEVQADPRPAPRAIDQQRLRLVLGRGESTALLTVASPPSTWPLGKLDITVPESFELLDCRLARGSDSAPLRATRPAPTRVVVFAPGGAAPPATAPATTPTEVRLYGAIEVATNRATPLPVVRVAGPSTTPLRVDLWRTPDTLVRLAAGPTLALDPPTTPRTPQQEIMAGSLRLAADQAPPQIEVAANEPRYRVSHVTAHERTPDGVRHEVAATVRVLGGEVSTLPLQLADDASLLELTAPTGATLVPAPLEGEGRWRVQLPAPLKTGQSTDLRMASPQEAAPGDHSAVLAQFPDAVESDALAALHAGPHLPDGRWRTGSLAPASGRHEAPTVAFAGPGWTLYQATPTSRAVVTWTRRDQRPPECLVRLAETTAAPDPLGRLAITTRLLLDPNGASFCRLQLDPQCELATIAINGRGPITSRESPGVWRVSLLNRRSPQTLSFTTVLTRAADRQVVTAPRLVSGQGVVIEPAAAAVELIDTPAARLRIPIAGAEITPGEAALLRLQAMLALPVRPTDASAWWLSRLRDAQQAVEADPPADDAADNAAVAQLLAEAEDRLDQPFAYHAGPPPLPIDGERRIVLLPDNPPELAIAVDARHSTDLSGRVLLALVAVAAAGGYHAACRRPELLGALAARHNTAVALGGLAWWLWLPLPACGLLLMAAAALAEARDRYHRILSTR